MYVLKIKTGPDEGKYVGRKGFRSWDWKAQEDINNARTFASIGGIKSFFGKRYLKGALTKLNEDWKIDRDTKKYNKEAKKHEIPYTKYYEAIELKIEQ